MIGRKELNCGSQQKVGRHLLFPVGAVAGGFVVLAAVRIG